MEDRIGRGFSEFTQRFREIVWMIHPSNVVRPKGNFEGGRWDRPHDICGLDPWNEQVMRVGLHGRGPAVKGDQEERTRDLASRQVVKVGFLG